MACGFLRFVGEWIIVDVRQGKYPYPKLGITVTRRYGKACQRNRFKRIVREAFRLSYSFFRSGLEIHVKPRSMAQKANRQQVQEELNRFVFRAQESFS
jgi:ribonuclease P protein component